MSLSKRERLLAVIVGGLLVLVTGRVGWSVFEGFGGGRSAQIASLAERLEKLQDQALKAKRDQDQMAQWNRRALPSDVARAGSLYQNWLLEIAGKAGFRQKKVDPGEVRARADMFSVLPFTLRGNATLDELVAFLFDFYSAGHLHQIRRMTIKPMENSKDLDVTLTIEALALPTADRKDQLTQEPANRLALASLEQYRKVIGGRNILAPYRAPVVEKPRERPPPEPETPPFDPSKYAHVTGIVEVGGRPEVWIKARTTDEKLQLHEGEKFRIGPFEATVAQIHPREVEIEVNGKRHTIPLGASVRGTDAGANGPKADSDGKSGVPNAPPPALKGPAPGPGASPPMPGPGFGMPGPGLGPEPGFGPPPRDSGPRNGRSSPFSEKRRRFRSPENQGSSNNK